MFKSIRLKLTLINITVVGIILILFLSGIYVLMKQNTERLASQQLRMIATESRRPQRTDPFPEIQTRRLNGGFYVEYDVGGAVLSQSDPMPVSDAELDTLLSIALDQKSDQGEVSLDSETFRYLRSYPPDMHSMTIAFLSTKMERETLARLGTILVIVGLGGLVIVFFSSLFLAGRALVPIRKSWERQQDFVADASHELRSPLAVMQTSLELVLGNREDTVESQAKWLENVQAENRRMTKLVDDLLFLARADSNQQTVNKTVFHLHDAVMEVVESHLPIAVRKGVTLTLDSEKPFEFYGDEGRIRQLLIILLDNALKFTPAGGRTEVELKQHDSAVDLIVADTGEGIAQEHLHRIFERFYRVDKARSRESGGTGLGLSIANWIVREHKGTISVTSKPGEGSQFKVTLPRHVQRG